MTTIDSDERNYDDYQDDIGSYCSLKSERAASPLTSSLPPHPGTAALAVTGASPAVGASVVVCGSGVAVSSGALDMEKRMRREIANSNERRRMQSINAGFQSLRHLLPHHEGEKLSKASILQQTAEYLYQLEREKTELLSQNCQLKRIIQQHESELSSARKKSPSPAATITGPNRKRKYISLKDSLITDHSSDEETTMIDEDMMEMRMQLDRERALRIHLEEKVQKLESICASGNNPVTTVTAVPTVVDHLKTEPCEQLTLQYHKEELKDDEGIILSTNGFTITTTSRRLRGEPEPSNTSIVLPAKAVDSLLNCSATSPLSMVRVKSSPPPTPCEPPPQFESSEENESSESEDDRPVMSRLIAPPARSVSRSPVSRDSLNTCVDPVTPPPPPTQLFLTSTSRQNLETIVEAIRHLEGDSFDSNISCSSSSSISSCSSEHQERPLALTTRSPERVDEYTPRHGKLSSNIHTDMNPFLKFHPNAAHVNKPRQEQHRPGVIVVKQQT